VVKERRRRADPASVLWFAVSIGSLVGLGALALFAMREGGSGRTAPQLGTTAATLVVDGWEVTTPEAVPDPLVRARIQRVMDEAGVRDLRGIDSWLQFTVHGRDYPTIASIPDAHVRSQLEALLGDVAD